MAPDGHPQTMQLVKPDALYSPGYPVGESYGFADKLDLGFLERTQDC
jgi:hypothetical protein